MKVAMVIVLQRMNATIPYFHSHQEDRFLRELGVPLRNMKPLGFNCTKVPLQFTFYHACAITS